MRVRVAVVIGKLDRGGTERHLLAVLPVLKHRGIETAVFTLQAGGVLTPLMRDAGIDVFEGIGGRGWHSLPALMIRLTRQLRVYRPNVMHFFLPEAYVVGSICSMFTGTARRVMSRRSLDDYQRKYPGFRTLESALHRFTTVLLGNSRAIIAQLKGEGAAPSKIGLIYSGIAPSALPSTDEVERARDQLDLADGVVAGLTIGNLIPYKGHMTLLDAIAALPDQAKNALVWFCVGRDDGIGADLQRHADEVGIGSIVRWEGEKDELSVYLSACDIAALPSKQEGFSNSLLEKMRAGLATVATDVGGNPDALEGCGLLIPADDEAALTRALLSLIEDEDRLALGRTAHDRVIRRFGLQSCAQAYADLYGNLASGAAMPVPESARIA